MNKKLIAFAFFLLFFSLVIFPQAFCKSPLFEEKDIGFPITPEDEGDHYPCGYELWFYHTQLILENGQLWDTCTTFAYCMNKTKDGYIEGVSFIRNRLWNRQTNECFDYLKLDNFPGIFNITKNEINLTYYNSSGLGLYPNYYFYIYDDIHNIETDFYLHATSLPCWIAQECLNSTLNWGFSGSGKAYFIPILEVNGNIIINNITYNATGFAYFEHDFADCNFGNPFAIYSLKEFFQGLQSAFSYTKWWLKQVLWYRPMVAPSWHRSSDYLAGWIWNWMVFENGYSVVIFRPVLLRFSAGIVPIVLYFSKDGVNYSEIGCVYWRNIREKYIERVDIYIPIEFEIIACKEDFKLYLTYNITTGLTELYNIDWVPYVERVKCTFYCCGNATGYYKDKTSEVQLCGLGALEQTRCILNIIKHRSRDIELILPPNGFGMSFRLRSHRLGFERYFKIQFFPFEFIFYLKHV